MGAPIALVASTTIFTLMHSGPISYLIVVFIAGLFYGYAYQLTKRIEASILLHFLVNLIHFLFFTYPMLRVDYGM
ncbi:MAG: lysostaphin resistance A-like protein [Alphaproteobacteria bacterium]